MAASPYLFRPSAMHRLVHCPGSAQLEAAYPQDEGESAREGTAAHWVATELLAGNVIDVGTAAPNGVVVTDEMIEGAELFVGAAYRLMPPENMRIERPVTMERIHPGNGGTPDLAGIGHDAWVLHVLDYKYGHGFVEAFENWQCVDYVVGVFDQMVAEGLFAATAEQHLTVQVTIVQPRSFHRDGPVRSWTVKMDALRPLVNTIANACELGAKANPPTQAGPWCDHCEAAAHCATLQRAGYGLADVAGDSIPFDLTPEQLGVELKWLRRARAMLDSRIEGLEVEATKMLQRGDRVPNWALESAAGNLAWLPDKLDEVFILGDVLGVDLRKPAAPITPTQALKLVDEAVIKELSYRPRGKAKLVPFTDVTTRKIFGG